MWSGLRKVSNVSGLCIPDRFTFRFGLVTGQIDVCGDWHRLNPYCIERLPRIEPALAVLRRFSKVACFRQCKAVKPLTGVENLARPMLRAIPYQCQLVNPVRL
jgi:hypothetical protein